MASSLYFLLPAYVCMDHRQETKNFIMELPERDKKGMNRENMLGLTWQGKWQHAVWVLRNEGIKSFLVRALGVVYIYRRLQLIHRFLDQPERQVAPKVQVNIGLLSKNEINEYLRFKPDSGLSGVRNRLETGQICFIVRHKGDIVHSVWAIKERAWIGYLSTQILLHKDELYIEEAYTLPAFRGQNISPTRSLVMARYFRDVGIRRFIAAVKPEEKQALRAAKKTGYRSFGVLGYVRFGPWRHDFCRMNKVHGICKGDTPRNNDLPGA